MIMTYTVLFFYYFLGINHCESLTFKEIIWPELSELSEGRIKSLGDYYFEEDIMNEISLVDVKKSDYQYYLEDSLIFSENVYIANNNRKTIGYCHENKKCLKIVREGMLLLEIEFKLGYRYISIYRISNCELIIKYSNFLLSSR